MSTPVLYSFRRCPYAIRARMAIKYSGIECELREVVLKNKPEAMLRASPKGTVPVLVTSDKVIDESLDVMRWALQSNNPDDWLISELEHSLVQRNDDYFKTYLDRYKYFERYPQVPQRAYFDKALVFLDELESAMVCSSNGEYYLLKPELSTVDVAIFPFVRQFAFVDKDAFDSLQVLKVQAWLELMLNAELFLSIMPKLQAWSPGATQKYHV